MKKARSKKEKSEAAEKPVRKARKTRIIALAVVLAVLIAAAVFIILQQPKTAKPGDVVLVEYVGSINSTVFDTNVEKAAREAGIHNPSRNYKPLELTIGAGNFIRGFEDALYKMREGETKTVTLKPELAYGEYDPRKISTFPLASINGSEEINVGSVLTDKYGLAYRVVEVNSTHAFVDTNHPLAGKTLVFEIKLIKIK